MAAHRYVAVCRPYHASTYCSLRLTRNAIAAIAVFAGAYNVPHFFETEMTTIPPANNASNGTVPVVAGLCVQCLHPHAPPRTASAYRSIGRYRRSKHTKSMASSGR